MIDLNVLGRKNSKALDAKKYFLNGVENIKMDTKGQ